MSLIVELTVPDFTVVAYRVEVQPQSKARAKGAAAGRPARWKVVRQGRTLGLAFVSVDLGQKVASGHYRVVWVSDGGGERREDITLSDRG